MRLQTFLSRAGVCSRRAAVKIIKHGNITVNGNTVREPGFKVNPERDEICLARKKIMIRQKVYIMLNKPRGVICTRSDRFAKRTILDLLPGKYRYLYPAGRLDRDTTGLLLLTNDGDFMYRLTHPRYNVEKVYMATLDRRLFMRDKIYLEKGVFLDGSYTMPCRIIRKNSTMVEIALREGRKRQIKRMFSKMGYRVLSLKRIKEGPLMLGNLPAGKWRFLTQREIDSTKKVFC